MGKQVRLMLHKYILALAFVLYPFFASAAEDDSIRKIIDEKCHLCHGYEGESSSAIYPRLAGQNASYIAKQLSDFKSGKRSGTMTDMVTDLTPEQMEGLGRYYAAKPALSHKIRDKDFFVVGKYLYEKGNKYSGIASCKSCHGETGEGTAQLPRLAGQHKNYIKGQLEDFHDRERTNDNSIMHTIASKLTEWEIAALALYVSGM